MKIWILACCIVLVVSHKLTCQNSLEQIGSNFNVNELKTSVQNFNNQIVYGEGFAWGLTLGAHIELAGEGNGSLRFFAAAALIQNMSKGDVEFLGTYQAELELYRGGLGSSSFKLERDKFNLEWRNTFQLSVGGTFVNNPYVYGRPITPTIGSSFSALYDPLDLAGHVGTIFINGLTHSRNQQLGFFKLSVFPAEIFYVNDGPPFGRMGLGDTFDRYWTGVGGLGFYSINTSPLTSASLLYARYTGDDPLVYELSDLLGMNYMTHKKPTEQFFNKGRFQYNVGLYGAVNVGFSVYQPRWTDVQDLIHYGSFTFHSNPSKRYFSESVNYSFRSIHL